MQEHSDSELVTYKRSITQTSVSVFDLIASEKIPCQAPTQRSKTPQSRFYANNVNYKQNSLMRVSFADLQWRKRVI